MAKPPGHGAAPIVTDDDGLLLAEVFDDRHHIRHEHAHAVVLDALRLVTQIVTALVDGHDTVVRRQCCHLMSPRVPEIRKAVDHDDERSFAHGGVMNFHTVVRGVTVFNLFFHIGILRGRGEGAGDCSDHCGLNESRQ